MSSFSLVMMSAVLLGATNVYAQTNLAKTPYPAANEWMTAPVLWLPANDPVPAAVRAERNQYFDAHIGFREPLTPATVTGAVLSDGAYLGKQPEIPNLPNRTVVIGTFTASQPVLSNSGRSIYTEAQFLVTNVFQDAAGNLNPGGTLEKPRRYSLQPQKTYLLVLSFHASGAFYTEGKSWDLSGGTVQANFDKGIQASSQLLGLTIQQAINQLNVQFGQQ